MQVVSAVNSTSAPADDSRGQKAMRAAIQFEAVLLNSLFSGLERAFSTLPGKKQEDASADTYHAIAMQTLTTSLADAGGIGIARTILPHLVHAEGAVSQGTEAQATKVPLPHADGAGIWEPRRAGPYAH